MTTPNPPLQTPGVALAALLTEFLEANVALHANLVEQREAVRAAQPQRARQLTEAHAHLVTKLAAIDQRRRELVVTLSKSLALPRVSRATTLTDLARHLPEPDRTRVLSLAEKVRERVGLVHHESASLRAAARTLAAHMEGLMRHVGRQLTSAGVYSPRGQLTPGGSFAAALDLKS